MIRTQGGSFLHLCTKFEAIALFDQKLLRGPIISKYEECQVARAPVNKKHKRRVQVEWRYFLRHAPDKSLPPAFTVDEIYQALHNMKAGTAPGYDHVHPEFLKNLDPRAQTWCHAFSLGSLLRTQSQKSGERRR